MCGVCVVCGRTLRLERWDSVWGRWDSWLPLEGGQYTHTHNILTYCTQSSSSDLRLPMSRGKSFRQLLVRFRVSNARNPPTPSVVIRGDIGTTARYRHHTGRYRHHTGRYRHHTGRYRHHTGSTTGRYRHHTGRYRHHWEI